MRSCNGDTIHFPNSLRTHSFTMDDSRNSPETERKPRATAMTGGKYGERRLQSRFGDPTAENQPLPCPRCSSANTKFCYYNNYNLSQPRHFCKACRRYWTRGGTLRNVPVGGGTRKSSSSSSNKRSRANAADEGRMIKARATEPEAKNPNPNTVMGIGSDPEPAGSMKGNDDDSAAEKQGNLSSWWSTTGLGTLDGYGLGFGFCSGPGPSIGFDHGLLNWPIEQMNAGVECDGGALVSGESTGGSHWQVDGGGSGECEYFSWPDLSTATPADARK